MQVELLTGLPLVMVAYASVSPFVAFALIHAFTYRYARLSAIIALISSTGAIIGSLYLLVHLWHLEAPHVWKVKWMVFQTHTVPFGFYLDPHSLLMLLIVAGISWLVQVYSLGYMSGDPEFGRFYGCLSLFAWSMINLVIAPGMFQLFIFWELVGLSSYFLIGFFHYKESASEAGKKAFVVTRFADIGFMIGIFLLFLQLGTLELGWVNGEIVAEKVAPTMITICAILIFSGVMGKSAQFPLLTWLPDAMEGPTPVSALLHSATMVAAGVYMMSRIFPFFAASHTAMLYGLVISTITMLLSSTMAMVTRDIKQVWAYSTVSQLGFMVMGLSAGSYFAGTFHLTTHAGFKALLFLCSGVLIHEFHTNDFFEIGMGGGKRFKVPIITITIGALALAGIFPLSGFFSKEAIMGQLANLDNKFWLAMGLLGAFLTAYYSFRLIFSLWFPAPAPEHGHGHGHDSHGHDDHGHDDHGHDDHHDGSHEFNYWAMCIPLIILATITVFLGFFQGSLEHFLGQGHVHMAAHGEGGEGHHTYVLVLAVGLALSGIGLAYWEFGRKDAPRVGFIEKVVPVATLFAKRWYLDHFWRKFLDYIIYGIFSNIFTRNDRRVIDGGIDGFCRATIGGGFLASFLQSGRLQYNLMVAFCVVALLGLYFLFS